MVDRLTPEYEVKFGYQLLERGKVVRVEYMRPSVALPARLRLLNHLPLAEAVKLAYLFGAVANIVRKFSTRDRVF